MARRSVHNGSTWGIDRYEQDLHLVQSPAQIEGLGEKLQIIDEESKVQDAPDYRFVVTIFQMKMTLFKSWKNPLGS